MHAITPVVPGVDLEVSVYAKDQDEYLSLPCYRDADGMVTIRWQLTWRERLDVLFGGCIWHQVLTFNRPLQPVKLVTECPLKVASTAQGNDDDFL